MEFTCLHFQSQCCTAVPHADPVSPNGHSDPHSPLHRFGFLTAEINVDSCRIYNLSTDTTKHAEAELKNLGWPAVCAIELSDTVEARFPSTYGPGMSTR